MSNKNFDTELQKNLEKIRKRQIEKRKKKLEKLKNMPKKEKDELKQKYKNKLEMQKYKRMKKIQKKKMNDVKYTLTPGNSKDIYTATVMMKKDVKDLQKKGIHNILELDKLLTDKYIFLKEKYIAIYRAVIRNELPLEVLLSMLKQKDRVENKEISEEKASLEMGNMFAKKLNVDVDALVKSGMENKQKMENKKI